MWQMLHGLQSHHHERSHLIVTMRRQAMSAAVLLMYLWDQMVSPRVRWM